MLVVFFLFFLLQVHLLTVRTYVLHHSNQSEPYSIFIHDPVSEYSRYDNSNNTKRQECSTFLQDKTFDPTDIVSSHDGLNAIRSAALNGGRIVWCLFVVCLHLEANQVSNK